MIGKPILLLLPFVVTFVAGQRDERCSDFEEDGFYCVPYYLCNGNNKIITDGSGIITIRTSAEDRFERALNSKCDKIVETCCHLESVQQSDPERPVRSPDISRPRCGVRHEDGIGEGTRREELEPNQSLFGEWPHVCMLIEMVEGGISSYRAGASLLDKNVVLTGASKVYNDLDTPEIFIIRCGDWNAKVFDEFKLPQERKVERIVIHPEFNNESLHNNFAVLFLEQDFVFDDHVNPVCVPQPKVDFPLDADCYAQGWGKDRFTGQYQTILKSLNLKLVSHDSCEQELRNTRLTENFELDESFLCAGKDQDTCTGDGGSPLVCKKPESSGIYVQVGIVSWGISCGSVPGVYASLPYAMCWIDEVVSCFKNPQESSFGYTSADCENTAPFNCS